MRNSSTFISEAVNHYLQTGEHDPNHRNWPGQNFMEVAANADRTLREALIAEVQDKARKVPQPSIPHIGDLATLTRDKVAPMVNGLFPAGERPAIMAILERSVVFLTPDSIESTLRSSPWLSTTWSLANMYLISCGAEPLSPQARSIVGLCEETTCYLSLDYLENQEQDPFSDYLVHEAAHVFHNCRRCTVGLPETRTRHALLNIHFTKRETFAYACEAYSRILLLADSPQRRRDALMNHSQQSLPREAGVDRREYLDILTAAVDARNGWKGILQACAPRNPNIQSPAYDAQNFAGATIG